MEGCPGAAIPEYNNNEVYYIFCIYFSNAICIYICNVKTNPEYSQAVNIEKKKREHKPWRILGEGEMPSMLIQDVPNLQNVNINPLEGNNGCQWVTHHLNPWHTFHSGFMYKNDSFRQYPLK